MCFEHYNSHKYYSSRSRFGSRTGGPSSRSCTKTAKFPWSTAPTPATPWPVTHRLPRLCGRTAPHRTPRSTDLRSRSRRTTRRRPIWRTITTTGTSRDHIYSTRAPCTIQSLSRAWGRFIDSDSKAHFQFNFIIKTRSVNKDCSLDREADLKVKRSVFGL